MVYSLLPVTNWPKINSISITFLDMIVSVKDKISSVIAIVVVGFTVEFMVTSCTFEFRFSVAIVADLDAVVILSKAVGSFVFAGVVSPEFSSDEPNPTVVLLRSISSDAALLLVIKDLH